MGNYLDARVYVVTNMITQKQYVGQTTVMRDYRGHGVAMSDAYKKYGVEAFTYEAICTGRMSRQTLNYLERFWITVLDSRAPNGYNLEAGGTDKGEILESTRQKLSALNKGKRISMLTRLRISDALSTNNPFTGRKHTEEARAKISAAHARREYKPLSDYHKALLSEIRRAQPTFKGRKHSDEQKVKWTTDRTGKKLPPFTEEHRRNIAASAVRRNQSHLTCPVCGHQGRGPNMYRYHFTHCSKQASV